MKYLYIFIPVIIEGFYDFAVWYGLLKERSGHKLEWLYRLLKEITDIIIIPALLLIYFNWSAEMLAAFYILKWFGWCDAVYIILWRLFNPKREYTQEGIWWLWWTPLGMIRSQIIYKIDYGVFEPYEIMRLFGNWWLKKGIISLREFRVQLIIGVVISLTLILLF